MNSFGGRCQWATAERGRGPSGRVARCDGAKNGVSPGIFWRALGGSEGFWPPDSTDICVAIRRAA